MRYNLNKGEFDYTFPLIVAFSGWLLLVGYLYYFYIQYSKDIVALVVSTDGTTRTGTVLVILAPLISSILGYALNERLKSYRQQYLQELHFKNLAEDELRETLDRLILSFVNALDSKSPWTKGHSIRVRHYGLQIAEELKLPAEQLELLAIAALLHDIGKIGTYDNILNKAGKLTTEEYALVKQHPGNAVNILAPITQLSAILPIIRGHHERVDGQGYPDGLKGQEIPRLARILCLADAYDAITSERPYKACMDRQQAISTIQRASGQFDPDIVCALIAAHGKPTFEFTVPEDSQPGR